MNISNVRKLEIMARPSPCDGCHNNTRCGFELLACRAFEHYVHSGYVGNNIAKVPDRKIFNAVFYEDNPSSMKELRKQLRKEL